MMDGIFVKIAGWAAQVAGAELMSASVNHWVMEKMINGH
jgi:hypothetical protein